MRPEPDENVCGHCAGAGEEIVWQLRIRQDYDLALLHEVFVLYAVLACKACGVVYDKMTREEIEAELNQPTYEAPEPKSLKQITDDAVALDAEKKKKFASGVFTDGKMSITRLDAEGAPKFAPKFVWKEDESGGRVLRSGDTITFNVDLMTITDV